MILMAWFGKSRACAAAPSTVSAVKATPTSYVAPTGHVAPRKTGKSFLLGRGVLVLCARAATMIEDRRWMTMRTDLF
jgi:hypothetical protein